MSAASPSMKGLLESPPSLDGLPNPDEKRARRWSKKKRATSPLERKRKRRHGRPRPSSAQPMAPAVRTVDDARWTNVGGPELRDAWGAWIDSVGPWVWFTTHTFKADVSPDRALRLLDRWLARLAEACRQKSRSPPELRCAIAVEWTCRARVHLHAAVSAQGLEALRRILWRHRWERLDVVCGMARVHSAKDRASAYLAK